MKRSADRNKGDVPDVIFDTNSGVSYKKGKLLGKGGFARCYEFKDQRTQITFAGKVVMRASLKPKYEDKLRTEIKIHKSLSHPNVVRVYNVFHDSDAYYILMEKCSCLTLSEWNRNRRGLTEPEVRFIMRQLIASVQYIHSKGIIHRDLKTGNVMLDSEMTVKVGDFGLAAQLHSDDERRFTMCGTPNYIAPEIIATRMSQYKGSQKKVPLVGAEMTPKTFFHGVGASLPQGVTMETLIRGHGYAADVWCIGVIMFVMLYGRVPFESTNIKEIYKRIMRLDFMFPSSTEAPVGDEAKDLIRCLLKINPADRPSLKAVLAHPWFKQWTPDRLHRRYLKEPPEWASEEYITAANRRIEQAAAKRHARMKRIEHEKQDIPIEGRRSIDDRQIDDRKTISRPIVSRGTRRPGDDFIPIPSPTNVALWIVSWIDQTTRYGLAYQLSNGSVGVHFNDHSYGVVSPLGLYFQYHRPSHLLNPGDNAVLTGKMSDTHYVGDERKKVKLLKYFYDHIESHSLYPIPKEKRDRWNPTTSTKALPHVCNLKRTSGYLAFRFSDATTQINFSDHTKIILGYDRVGYIDSRRKLRSYTPDMYTKPSFSYPEFVEKMEMAREIAHRAFHLE
ncbi:Kinase, PLK [Aduncisulcus paluster]|uniref:Serine/threonine-protein kinase PLK n=1 Tax=Aduncisulcus paluster TaxID=2918883 RepID=A0ABQ5KSE5_9EUKA|nr:Kinase, PLK [Aduncisulcus paluster]